MNRGCHTGCGVIIKCEILYTIRIDLYGDIAFNIGIGYDPHPVDAFTIHPHSQIELT